MQPQPVIMRDANGNLVQMVPGPDGVHVPMQQQPGTVAPMMA